MRLCQQPMFLVEPPLLSEKEDLLSSATLYDDRSISQSSFGLSETLLLPSSFGNVYLGEIFRSYISINNSSNAHVSSVGLKVELQTPSNRFSILLLLSLLLLLLLLFIIIIIIIIIISIILLLIIY